MTDTAAALVIQLSADFKDFQRQMQKATGVFDAEGRKLAKRQENLKKKLSDWALDFSGLKGINKALVGITGAAAVAGLFELTKAGLEAASAIGDVSTAAGVSVEFLQKMRFAASQSGASFDVMDEALVTLNKTFGEFVNTGAGKGAQTFKTLGIDKLIGGGQIRDTQELFDVLVKKLSAFGSEAQKAGFLASVFGKEAGPKLLQLVDQGSEGIAKLEAQAVSLGIVLSGETVRGAKEANDKLTALFNVMKAQGVAAVAALAPEIAHLVQSITEGLPALLTWTERWAAYFGLIDLSPVQKIQQQIDAVVQKLQAADQLKDSALLNPLGLMSANIDAGKAQLLQKLESLKSDMADALSLQKPGKGNHPLVFGPHPFLPDGRGPALKINDIAGDKAAKDAAAKAEALRLRRQQFLAQTVVDQKTAQAALLAAQDQGQVQTLRGTADYYAAVKKQIDDEYKSEVDVIQAKSEKQKAELDKQGKDWAGYGAAVANINQQMNDEIAAADEKRKQAQFDAGAGKLTQDALIQSKEQIQAYQSESAALGLTAGATARFQFIQQQLNEARLLGITLTQKQIEELGREGDAVGAAAQSFDDAQRAIQRDIEGADDFRHGLEDLGVAGLKGFDSLQDAAVNFLETMAEMILRLYVLRPLIEDTFGKAGTSLGGGGGGGFISSILSLFADGGIATPNGPRALKRMAGGGVRRTASIFAEKGPEAAVPLPDGRSIPVDLRMPKANAAGGGAGITVLQQFDLTGAVVTDDLYNRINETAARQAQAAVSAYDRNVVPSRVRTLVRDPRRSY